MSKRISSLADAVPSVAAPVDAAQGANVPDAPGLIEIFGILTGKLERQVEDFSGVVIGGGLAIVSIGVATVILLLLASRVMGRGRGRAQVAIGSQASVGLRVATLAVILTLFALLLYDTAPLLVLALAAAFFAAFVFTLGLSLRTWAGGMLAILRGRVRLGQKLRFQDLAGTVQYIGLFRMVLRAESGDDLYVPIGQLQRRNFSVSSPDRGHPVEMNIRVEKEPDGTTIQRIRWATLRCPYRDCGTPIQVKRQPDGRAVQVRFRAWSDEAAIHAEEHIRNSVSATVHKPAA